MALPVLPPVVPVPFAPCALGRSLVLPVVGIPGELFFLPDSLPRSLAVGASAVPVMENSGMGEKLPLAVGTPLLHDSSATTSVGKSVNEKSCTGKEGGPAGKIEGLNLRGYRGGSQNRCSSGRSRIGQVGLFTGRRWVRSSPLLLDQGQLGRPHRPSGKLQAAALARLRHRVLPPSHAYHSEGGGKCPAKIALPEYFAGPRSPAGVPDATDHLWRATIRARPACGEGWCACQTWSTAICWLCGSMVSETAPDPQCHVWDTTSFGKGGMGGFLASDGICSDAGKQLFLWRCM